MSSNQAMEEMVRNWTEMQQKMWENWQHSMQHLQMPEQAAGAGMQEPYRSALETWQKSVREALDAQAQWTQRWADQAGNSGAGAPAGVEEMAKQTQEMMKAWTEAQSRLWNAWFDSVKNMDPTQMAQTWEAEGQQVLKAWQDATRRSQEAMQAMSRTAGPGGTSGAGSAKKS